jgi:hypothetical protein
MTDNTGGGAPQILHTHVDTFWSKAKEHVWMLVSAAVVGLIAAVGAWFLGLAKWAMDEAAIERLAGDEEFAARVAKHTEVVGLEIGSVIAWPTSRQIPTGWHVCDGSAIDARPEDPIAKVLESDYGTSGVGKLKLPDYRGYFLRGLDNRSHDNRVDPDGPREVGRPQVDSIGAMDLDASNPKSGYRLSASDFVIPIPTGTTKSDPSNENSSQRLAASKKATEIGKAETRPKNYAVHWIIRVK